MVTSRLLPSSGRSTALTLPSMVTSCRPPRLVCSRLRRSSSVSLGFSSSSSSLFGSLTPTATTADRAEAVLLAGFGSAVELPTVAVFVIGPGRCSRPRQQTCW